MVKREQIIQIICPECGLFPSRRQRFVCWVLSGEVSTPTEAVQHVASCKGIAMERLTIPSQRRYLSYFSSVMEGVR